MTKTRPDFQADRNQLIYNDYLSGKYSYSQLSSKYKITSQRTQSIVKDFQARGFGKTLKENAPLNEREDFKNEAVKIRENGNLIIAENMFKQVINWDLNNRNPKGAIDVYGHLRIVYSRIGRGKRTNKEKLVFYKKAEKSLVEAISLSNRFPETIDLGRIAILNTHLAGSALEQITLLNDNTKKEKLEKALKLINLAIKNLPGSQAHLSWPKKIKGEILYNLGKREESIKILLEAEKDLFLGYKQEIQDKQEKEFVIGVWLSGIHLALANIALDMERYVIAKHYATSVINTEDKTGILNERKKDAKRILDSLKESSPKSIS